MLFYNANFVQKSWVPERQDRLRMWKAACIAAILVIALFSATDGSRDNNNKKYKVVCYLGSWANYRYGDGKFLIEHIDPFMCTHVVYGFAKLNPDNKIAAYDPYLDLKENWGLGAFQRFNALKKQNPHLTTILAIGGWNEGSVKYSNMASNPATRKIFVESCVEFLTKYDFDGLDMDWEYPGTRGGKPEDKQNFVLLLKELKEAFNKEGGFILTAAVSAGKATIDAAYNITKVSEHLDFVNLMAYDFHGSWETFTGHNAPLYSRPGESENDQMLNVDFAVNYWLKNGCPKEKLVLGMALYGRSFTLKDANKNGLGEDVTGKGEAGPITREGGMLGYNEICQFVLQNNWNVVWDENHQAPYAYKDRQWVGYDDEKSIAIKVEYLMEKGLGGGMVWSIETDDFRGKCHGKNYPLLTIIQTKLNGPIDRPTFTEGTEGTTRERVTVPTKPTQPPSPVTVTTDTGLTFKCDKAGLFPHPSNCKKFMQCYKDGESLKLVVQDCPPGTAFNENVSTCGFPSGNNGC